MFKRGDTLLLPKPGQNVAHLWVILTEPHPETMEVLMVNLTTRRPHSDTTTILQPGEHPFIDHSTVVNYYDARMVKVELLESYLRTGTYVPQPSVTPEILKRLEDGLLASRFTPNKIKTYFRANHVADW